MEQGMEQEGQRMRCQHCGSEQTWVLDSRMTQDGFVRRRRYHCGSCRKRFTTYEIVEKHCPELLDEIKKRINEGRWTVTAAD